MASTAKSPVASIDTTNLPLDTKELRKALHDFLRTPIEGYEKLTVGSCTYGVYAFFDYDDEPIYVGQTRESLGTRIRRHLTNQRTDAVAMSVLDPFEVHTIQVWPLPQFETAAPANARAQLDRLEATVFALLVQKSRFKAVLNEKVPVAAKVAKLPADYKGVVVTGPVKELRGHPDIRLARRAATIARLAQVICERDVQPGLRRTLRIQAERLQWLATERLKPFEGEVDADDKKSEEDPGEKSV